MSGRKAEAEPRRLEWAWQDLVMVIVLLLLLLATYFGCRPQDESEQAPALPGSQSRLAGKPLPAGQPAKLPANGPMPTLSIRATEASATEPAADLRAARVAILADAMRPAAAREQARDAIESGRKGLAGLRAKREDCLARQRTVFGKPPQKEMPDEQE